MQSWCGCSKLFAQQFCHKVFWVDTTQPSSLAQSLPRGTIQVVKHQSHVNSVLQKQSFKNSRFGCDNAREQNSKSAHPKLEMKPQLFLTTLLALTLAHAQSLQPATLMTTRAEELLNDTLNAASSDWKAAKGAWQIVDGALQGAELAKDNHPAAYRRNLNFQDAVIQFDFKLEAAKMITFSINDTKGHVARVVINAKGFQARKDDHDHEGADKAVMFNRVNTPITASTWHTMMLEIHSTEMLARLVTDDATPLEKMPISFGQHEMIGVAKTNIGFTLSGSSASFRNLQVFKALENTTWAATKQKLEGLKKP